ncbi:MAG: hypothetical protein NT001_00020 [Candidatus Woesearchaeota archaeon]|nr:hypothetical protein [Candidatus Woesearchaeota archaeon]
MRPEDRLKERERELIKLNEKLKLCEDYKRQVISFVNGLEQQHYRGLIDEIEYKAELYSRLEGRSHEEWLRYYDDYIEECRREIRELSLAEKGSALHDIAGKEQKEEWQKRQETRQEKTGRKTNINLNLNIKLIAVILFMIIVISSSIIFRPQLTGFVVNLGGKQIESNYTVGYDAEGTKWADVMGSRMYERCLKVESGIYSESVLMNAEVTAAGTEKDLTLGIYNQSAKDEPESELGSCIVNDYSSLWKSCRIDDLKMDQGIYWICAYSPGGSADSTYYTIAYDNGGNTNRALWTGKYWQKLENAAYSITAEFIQWKK